MTLLYGDYNATRFLIIGVFYSCTYLVFSNFFENVLRDFDKKKIENRSSRPVKKSIIKILVFEVIHPQNLTFKSLNI